MRTPVQDKPVAPFPFAGKANARELRANPQMSRIFETLFQVDIWEEFKRLRTALKVGEKHRDYATLMKSLDEAEDNSRIAHSLFVNARMLPEGFDANALVIESQMRKEATQELQDEKASGQRSKAITDADIVAQCATMFADEWTKLQADRKRHKLTVDHIEHLVDCWRSRCKSLQTMVAKVR
jgi:hypothetical protein